MTNRLIVVDRLIELLDQGDEVDRCYAAQALGTIADPRAYDSLYEHLQDEDLDVCVDAAMALGKLGDEIASQGLVDALSYHGASDVKLAAAQALHSCGGDIALQALRPLVLERPEEMGMSETQGWDDWWDLQLEAVKAMGTHGYQPAIDDIVTLLDEQDSQDIESEALKALAQMGREGINTLRRKLARAQPRSQRRIASALGYATHSDALVLLRELLASELAEVREAACLALARRGDAEAAALLTPLLEDEDAAVQVAALKGLGRLSISAVDQQTCINLLGSSSSKVRETSLVLLNKVIAEQPAPNSELAALCIASMQAKSDDESVAACQLLGLVGNEENVEAVLEMFENQERSTIWRCQALNALGALGVCSDEVMEQLLAAARNPQRAVRHAALRSLLLLDDSNHAELSEQTPLQLLHDMASRTEPESTSSEPGVLDEVASSESEMVEEEQSIAEQVSDEPKPDLIQTVMVDDKGQELPADGTPVAVESSLQSILDGMSNSYPEMEESSFSTVPESTMDAITRSNAEAAVVGTEALSSDSERIMKMVTDLPEELSEFAGVVQENARTGERMLNRKQRRGGEDDDDRRVLAIQVLGDSLEEETVTRLLACLMDDNAELRQQAVDSLGMIARRKPDIDGLSNCLGAVVTQMHAGTEEMRMSCARTLGAMGHKSAIKPLFGALEDPDTLVRIQAIRSLVDIELGSGKALTENDHVLLDEITPTRVIKAIRERSNDPQIGVRAVVIDALAALNYPDVGLIVELGLEEGGALSETAVKALMRMNIDEATEQLLQGLSHPLAMKRRLAMQMLAALHGGQAA